MNAKVLFLQLKGSFRRRYVDTVIIQRCLSLVDYLIEEWNGYLFLLSC
jgi:hypothetical protein